MNIEEFFRIGMDRKVYPPLDAPDGKQLRVNLGHGSKKMPQGVISIGLPAWDAEKDRLPFADNEVREIWALHFLEHIWNIGWVMSECQRVLCPAGVMNICVPYGHCHMALQDPDHKRFFNEDTWRHFFDNPYYRSLVPVKWTWTVHFNMIMGVKGENLALMTQLIKGA